MKIRSMIRDYFPNLYKKMTYLKKEYLINKFKFKYPTTKLFLSIEQFKYAQGGQDFIIFNEFFKGIDDGIYCDVGGNHPLKFSNTKYFEDKGWSGYVFEPLIEMKELWDKERKAQFFQLAASNYEGNISFPIVNNDGISNNMFSFVSNTRDMQRNFDIKEVVVKARMLQNVFKEENIKFIDFMSIDVEGHEMNVLEGIDFNQVRINVISIENNPQNFIVLGDDKIRDIMFKNNYIFWGRIIELDDIYVHKDFINK